MKIKNIMIDMTERFILISMGEFKDNFNEKWQYEEVKK